MSWDIGTVWNNQSLFFRRIQNLRRGKPINIWCLDRCSVKYSFPQVKLLSMLLIKRLQKKHIVCPFSFPFLSLVLLFSPSFMKNKSQSTFCVSMCGFFFFSQNKGRKQGERINYSKNYLRSVRKLWGQGRYNSLLTKEGNTNDLIFHSLTAPQSSHQLLLRWLSSSMDLLGARSVEY